MQVPRFRHHLASAVTASLLSLLALSSCQTDRNPRVVKGQRVLLPAPPEPTPAPVVPKKSKPNPYANPTRGLKNPDVFVPRVVPPGSRTKYSSAKVNGKYLAMTFDDGPHPSHTPRLLDMLAERNIKATFYVVATRVREHPQIIRRMINEGHEVGNHTVNHKDLTKIGESGVRSELSGCADAIYKACGVRPRTMRPPYGAITENIRNYVHRDYGYPTILWNVDPKDWKDRNASIVTRRLVAGAKNGGILLAHDIHKTTVDAMPNTFDSLLQKGFKFVTVTQLLSLESRATVMRSRQLPPVTSPIGEQLLAQVKPMVVEPLKATW